MPKEVKVRKGYLTLVFFGILLLQISSVACGTKGTNIPDEVKQSIKKRVDNRESVGLIVGSIDAQGNREYLSYGTLTMNGKEPVDKNSVYEIGSISKVFTCIALADMVLKGEMNLEDPAEKYLPETVKMPMRNGGKITLGHLAANISALPRMPLNFRPRDPGNPYADYTVENLYAFLSAYTLQRNIGEKYEYSNLGMGLLGHILGLKAGMGYEQLIVDRICRVLGMDDTRITLTTDMKNRLAKGHNPVSEVPNWDIPALAGAGALRSTAEDMLTFLGANMGTERTPLLEATAMTHEPRVDAAEGMKVGLGWHIRDNGRTQIVWHNGGTGGYRAFCGFIKDQKIGVVVLSNMNIGADDIGFHVLDSSYALKKIEKTIELESEALEKFAGRYKFDKAPITVAITRKEQSLEAQIPGQANIFFFPVSETDFIMKGEPIRISFEMDNSGEVTGLVLNQAGRDSGATKIE